MDFLELYKGEIEKVEKEIARLIRRRIDLEPFYDAKSEEELTKRYNELAEETGLDPEMIASIFKKIVSYSRKK